MWSRAQGWGRDASEPLRGAGCSGSAGHKVSRIEAVRGAWAEKTSHHKDPKAGEHGVLRAQKGVQNSNCVACKSSKLETV